LKASHSFFDGQFLSPGNVLQLFADWQLAKVAQRSADASISEMEGMLAFEKEDVG
jgi:hypothetical protein